MNSDPFEPQQGEGVGRFIGAVFGFVFFGIGVSVIGFLWSAPFGEFGSPPVFFRIFGSFIALAFVAMGGGTAYAAITGKANPAAGSGYRHTSRIIDLRNSRDESPEPPSRDGYSCNSCGAPLDSNADVSPHGDVKCGHCDRWLNIHGRS